VIRLLRQARFRTVAVFADFEGRVLEDHREEVPEHVYVAVAV
jgi:hypothetical protein